MVGVSEWVSIVEGLDVAFGLFDHQMDISGDASNALARGEDVGSNRNVAHKVTVHHIYVDPVCAGCFDRGDLLSETREIGVEDPWGKNIFIYQLGLYRKKISIQKGSSPPTVIRAKRPSATDVQSI